MPKIPGPAEYWDMTDGEVRTVRVESYEEGWAYIIPRNQGKPERKRVDVLRLHLQPGVKPHLPQYWDITSGHLIVGLKPHLARPDLKKLAFTIQKFGEAPRARFSLEIEEPEG